jgi:hypothetical protein
MKQFLILLALVAGGMAFSANEAEARPRSHYSRHHGHHGHRGHHGRHRKRRLSSKGNLQMS